MKVLLIYIDFPELDLGGCYYTGVASVHAAVRQAGHDVSFWHMTKLVSQEEFLKRIRRDVPHVVGFSLTTPMYKHALPYLEMLKKHANVFTVIGGAHGRMACDDAILNSHTDAVCSGEGEIAFVELLDRLKNNHNYFDVDNFLFKDGTKIIKNKLSVIEDLNVIPDPDREIFDYKNLYEYTKEGRAKVATFMFSRGCPFNCAYCCNERMKRDYRHQRDKYVRFMKPERIVAQMKRHVELHPETQYIRLDDSNINLDKDLFRQFILAYKSNIRIPFSCHARPNLVDEETVSMLKDANCFLIMMGIEHGDAIFRRTVLRRSMSDSILKNAYALCSKYGIPVRSFAMTGLPFENLYLAIKTISVAAQLGTFDLSNSIFYPYPYTELKDICDQNGFEPSAKQFAVGPLYFAQPLKQPTISEKEVVLISKGAHIWLFLFALCYRFPLIGKWLAMVSAFFVKSLILIIPEKGLFKSFLYRFSQFDNIMHKVYKRFLFSRYCKKSPLLFGI